LTGSTHKKVLVERFDREPLRGYVNPQTWLAPAGLELISPSGAALTLPYEDIKVVGFVRDFEGEGFASTRRTFTSRPKAEGLWVHLLFRDGDATEGLMTNNLLESGPAGFMVTPPEAASNLQKLFVPRAALRQVRVLGVVGSPLRRRKRAVPEEQIKLFE
jgi:hypothetical protein